MGNCLVAVLTTPMKRRLIRFNISADRTDANYESAQTTRSDLSQGIIKLRKKFLPCNISLSSYAVLSTASSVSVLTSFSLIIIFYLPKATSWILHSLSGLRSIATYIGKPMFIHSPSIPYHLYIDSSAQTQSPGLNISAQ